MKGRIYSSLFSVASELAANAAPGNSEFRIVLDGYLGAIEGRANPFRRSTFYWRLWNAGRRAACCAPRAGAEEHMDSEVMIQEFQVTTNALQFVAENS